MGVFNTNNMYGLLFHLKRSRNRLIFVPVLVLMGLPFVGYLILYKYINIIKIEEYILRSTFMSYMIIEVSLSLILILLYSIALSRAYFDPKEILSRRYIRHFYGVIFSWLLIVSWLFIARDVMGVFRVSSIFDAFVGLWNMEVLGEQYTIKEAVEATGIGDEVPLVVFYFMLYFINVLLPWFGFVLLLYNITPPVYRRLIGWLNHVID